MMWKIYRLINIYSIGMTDIWSIYLEIAMQEEMKRHMWLVLKDTLDAIQLDKD